jgi:hypothetical protein
MDGQYGEAIEDGRSSSPIFTSDGRNSTVSLDNGHPTTVF